jgi:hypothetical protein
MDFSCAKCGKFWDVPDAGPEQLMVHVKMYAVAKKYGVHTLDELAGDMFQVACEREWRAEEFVDAVEYGCEMGSGELRKMVVETIAAHIEVVKKERMEVLLRREMQLAYELIAEKWTSGL